MISPYTEQGQSQIARQGRLAGQVCAYAHVNLTADVGLTESAALGEAIFHGAPTIDGLEVVPGGTALAVFEPPKTEFIGLAFAVVVLILAFGSVLAMGLPIAVALGGVGTGIGLIAILSNVFKIPDFTAFLGAMIGLGASGIDYALFIVARYREGFHAGRSPREATMTAMDAAGRAMIFAGVTVVVSFLGLLLIGIGWVGGWASASRSPCRHDDHLDLLPPRPARLRPGTGRGRSLARPDRRRLRRRRPVRRRCRRARP